MELEIIRSYHPQGTNGMLYYKSSLQCYTIELPWQHNAPQQSCIPEGRYRLMIRYSQKHKTHFILDDVKDRGLILIHPANDALKELRGCIAPVTTLAGEGKGSNSKLAFEKLKGLIISNIRDAPVYLTIKST
ncbi:MAG: DUF5675 family protein [Ferruginibacter sp.]